MGIDIGGYNQGYYAAAASAYVVARPPCPGPDYIWTGGYWERNNWRDGYWSRPAYHGYLQNWDRDYERDRFVNNGFRRDRDDDHNRSRYR